MHYIKGLSVCMSNRFPQEGTEAEDGEQFIKIRHTLMQQSVYFNIQNIFRTVNTYDIMVLKSA